VSPAWQIFVRRTRANRAPSSAVGARLRGVRDKKNRLETRRLCRMGNSSSGGAVEEYEDLSASGLTDEELAQSLGTISAAYTCARLDVSYSRCGPRAHSAICTLLGRNRSITKLDAQSCGTFAVGANLPRHKSFCEALGRNKTLRYLNLEGNGMGADALVFSKALLQGPCYILRVLDLSHNTLSLDPSFGAVCDALGQCSRLHTLLLGGNNFDTAEMRLLGKMVAGLKPLRRLDLSDNPGDVASICEAIKQQGGVYLLKVDVLKSAALDAIQECPSLKHLALTQAHHVHGPDAEWRNHSLLVRAFRHLQQLEFCSSGLDGSVDWLPNMVGSLGQLASLRSLRLFALPASGECWLMGGFKVLYSTLLRSASLSPTTTL
jgi:hypothetical protein